MLLSDHPSSIPLRKIKTMHGGSNFLTVNPCRFRPRHCIGAYVDVSPFTQRTVLLDVSGSYLLKATEALSKLSFLLVIKTL